MLPVSYDLAVWEGDRPDDDDAALADFEMLYERYVGAGEKAPPTARIAAYVSTLLERYPDINTEAGYPDSPWASAPLLGEASGPLIYFPMIASRGDEVSVWAARVAEDHGLVCFDPQTEQLRTPWGVQWRFEFTSVFGDSARNPDPDLVHDVLAQLAEDGHFIQLSRPDGGYLRATYSALDSYRVARGDGPTEELSRTQAAAAVDSFLSSELPESA